MNDWTTKHRLSAQMQRGSRPGTVPGSSCPTGLFRENLEEGKSPKRLRAGRHHQGRRQDAQRRVNYGMCGRAYDPRFLFMWPNHRIAEMADSRGVDNIDSVERGADCRTGAPAERERTRRRRVLSGTRKLRTDWASPRAPGGADQTRHRGSPGSPHLPAPTARGPVRRCVSAAGWHAGAARRKRPGSAVGTVQRRAECPAERAVQTIGPAMVTRPA